MAVWVQLPFAACEEGEGESDTWLWWEKLRALCRYNPLLGVLLEIGQNLPAEAFRSVYSDFIFKANVHSFGTL